MEAIKLNSAPQKSASTGRSPQNKKIDDVSYAFAMLCHENANLKQQLKQKDGLNLIG